MGKDANAHETRKMNRKARQVGFLPPRQGIIPETAAVKHGIGVQRILHTKNIKNIKTENNKNKIKYYTAAAPDRAKRPNTL